MTEQAITTIPQEGRAPLPVMRFNAALATEAMNDMRAFVRGQLQENVHYAKRTGSSKPSLEKPGAEVILKGFSCRPAFAVIYREHDAAREYAYYEVECQAIQVPSGVVFASGIGSCDTDREAGNQSFAWKCNAALKMAEKSAMTATALVLGCVSEFFTQDMEEMDSEQSGAPPCPDCGTPLKTGISKKTGGRWYRCPRCDAFKRPIVDAATPAEERTEPLPPQRPHPAPPAPVPPHGGPMLPQGQASDTLLEIPMQRKARLQQAGGWGEAEFAGWCKTRLDVQKLLGGAHHFSEVEPLHQSTILDLLEKHLRAIRLLPDQEEERSTQ